MIALNRVFAAALILTVASVASQPAYGQSVRTVTQPAYMKFRTVNPSFIPNLAAIRQINIRMSHGAGLKNRAVKKHIKNMVCPKNVQQNQQQIETIDDDSIASEFLPVAFTTKNASSYGIGPIASVETDAAKAWSKTFFLLNPQTNEKVSSRKLLAKDQALIYSKTEHAFPIGNSLIVLKKGSLVLLYKTSNGFRLINIKDDCRDSVEICTPSIHLYVKPGMEACVAFTAALKKEVAPDGIARRHVKTHCECAECHLSVSEVSLHSVMLNNALMNYLYHSNEASEKDLSEQALRMAAALAHMNRSQITYSWK